MNRKKMILIASVVSAHLCLFFFNFKNTSPPPKPKQSIVVNTYVRHPRDEPPGIDQMATGKQNRPKTPSGKVSSPEKRGPKGGSEPTKNSQKRKVLEELKEVLSKIETEPPPPSTVLLPKPIHTLSIDSRDTNEETDYSISLAHSLKEGLELPEIGEVKLRLTVSQRGRVLKVDILSAASIKNRRYLEFNLPNIPLPPFSEDLKNESAHTFTLHFCNGS